MQKYMQQKAQARSMAQRRRIATVTDALALVGNMCATSHLSYRKIVLKIQNVYFRVCEYIPSCKYVNEMRASDARV